MLEDQDAAYAVGVGYDQRGAPVALDYPSGAALAITRDERGLPSVFDYDPGTGILAEVATIHYDPADRLAAATLGNGVELSRTFDPRSLETSRAYTDTADTTVLAISTPDYDERGNLLTETVTGTIASGAQTDRAFTYDERSRLTDQDDDGDQVTDVSWTLDKLGNWTSNDQTGIEETRIVNADNEYTHGILGLSINNDENGNLLSGFIPLASNFDQFEFLYDWSNRLIQAKRNGNVVAAYTYDALGRRVTKVAGSTTTRCVYSGSQVIEEYENSSCVPARRFVLGPGLDQPILFETWNSELGTWNPYYYLRNRQGSIIALTDSGGTVKESYTYSAYGTPTLFDNLGQPLAESALANPYGYTGRRYDAESALYHYRNRMYSPALGRFLTRDPAGYIDGLNLYQYVLGNPLAYIDPWGLGAQLSTYEPSVRNRIGGLFDDMNRLLHGMSEDEWIRRGKAESWAELQVLENPDGYFAETRRSKQIVDGLFNAGSDMIPVKGELADFSVLTDPSQPWANRSIAGGSLALSLFSAGFTPNFGRFADEGIEVSADVIRGITGQTDEGAQALTRNLADEIPAPKTDIKVIGRQPDTAVAKDWPGHDVLDIDDWTPAKNAEWVDDGIQNAQDFYTASPETGNLIQTQGPFKGNPTVFAEELEQVKGAGYKKVVDTYIHPSKQ